MLDVSGQVLPLKQKYSPATGMFPFGLGWVSFFSASILLEFQLISLSL
jgi:hypothetical protein